MYQTSEIWKALDESLGIHLPKQSLIVLEAEVGQSGRFLDIFVVGTLHRLPHISYYFVSSLSKTVYNLCVCKFPKASNGPLIELS